MHGGVSRRREPGADIGLCIVDYGQRGPTVPGCNVAASAAEQKACCGGGCTVMALC